MTKSSASKSSAKESATPGVLPLPAVVVRHHARTIAGPMKEWVTLKRVPPVLLITGTSGIGKRSMAYYLAQWILCERSGFSEKPGSEDAEADLFGGGLGFDLGPAPPAEAQAPANHAEPAPCGECLNCQRALKGSWVDFTEIKPEDESSETLKIDQFRKLKTTLGFGAHEGSYKIILIPNADRMTTQAANSVLKLLEEPPKGWVFFLTASDPTLLLPTVVSRCQKLRLKPFESSDLLELLESAGVPADRKAVCAELAHGSWNKALSLADDAMWEQRGILFDFIHEPQSVINNLVDWAAQEPANFDLLVDQLEQFALELIQWSVSGETAAPEKYRWTHTDGRQALIGHARAVSQAQGGPQGARAFWLARAERLARARVEALAPLNRKLLTQDLLLPWLLATKLATAKPSRGAGAIPR